MSLPQGRLRVTAAVFQEVTRPLSELHYRLGKLIEDRPGVVNRPEQNSTHTWDSNVRHFDGMTLDSVVRPLSGFGEAMIAQAREEMGEERWQQLQAEWRS